MKRSEPKPESIDQAANRVTRSSSESEDMDLAAEATEGAPAKTLAPNPNRREKGAGKTGKPEKPSC